ncbi:hypothetical protein [Nitrolancea hollandica]|uniref:Uncharacterized protein n=1 Tax=Nitrolancea hollandica Lb TaxID=1129897 RepID=I4EIW3_9BACT|nr:hypothetical protein [Nitrolancea hollandica]CCF84625.1 exported hypothetical protein [Nitrolancea hollandica Lb]
MRSALILSSWARAIRGALIISAAITVLILAALVPPLLIPESHEVWTDSEVVAAYYAHQRIRNAGGPLQRLLNLKVTAREVRPDPTGCDWGHGKPVSSIVTVQTYTLFGIPAETWIIDCDSESVTRAWWQTIP